MKTSDKHSNAASIISRIFTILLCIIFGFTLLCNVFILFQTMHNPTEPPELFGTTPMVVLSGSMSGDAEDHIEAGDMILIKKVNPYDLTVGDVIAFKSGESIITHRIVEIATSDDDEIISFTTKGDANNTEDITPVASEHVIGIVKSRIPLIGNIVIFMHKPLGMILFVVCPLLLLFLFDFRKHVKKNVAMEKKTKALEEELAQLKKTSEAIEINDDEFNNSSGETN